MDKNKISEIAKGGYSNLPTKLKVYLEFIEEYLRVPASVISIGPEREQTIVR